MKIRLDKFICNVLGISRSEAKNALKMGQITVNGATAKTADMKIDQESDVVFAFGSRIFYKEFVYLLLNKPEGIISASNDPKRETVVDLAPEKYKHLNLFPVGRLDRDTTGILILTNDGDFAHKVISPKSGISKTYLVTLDGKLTDDMINIFKNGVVLADDTVLKPAKLEIISDNVARVTVTEGKYHQIKRMFGTVGLGVDKLHRESIGKLYIPKSVKAGECVELFDTELDKIFIC